MTQENRRKNQAVAPSDLSRLVRDYYGRHFSREEAKQEFDRLVGAVWADLLEAEQYGADLGFLLHVLVCTKYQRRTPNIERSRTLKDLTPRRRATLIGGLRALRQLEWEGFKEIFGPAGEKWAQEVYGGIEYIYQQLTGGAEKTPAFQIGRGARLTRRQAERPLTACIVSIMEELRNRHPKPAAATVVLLQKFGLLGPSRNRITAMEFVKKRARRGAREVSDRLSPIGNRVWLLRQTHADLREFLMPPPTIPDQSPIWAEKGKAWKVAGPTFRRAFRRFCKFPGLRPTAQALAEFERSLQAVGGSKGPGQIFRNSTSTDSQRRRRQK